MNVSYGCMPDAYTMRMTIMHGMFVGNSMKCEVTNPVVVAMIFTFNEIEIRFYDLVNSDNFFIGQAAHEHL